jgi:predicted MFS family arabinose efflux permease
MSATSPTPLPRLLHLFGLVNLVIGSAAFMNAGLLVPMAQSLGVGVAAVGQAMTVYSLTTAVLAPAFLVATARLAPRSALALALALFALGNVATALAPDLATLLGARVLMGCGSAATALMAGLAVAIAPVERRAQALSIVFVGMSLSYVTGIPLATWAGLQWGWRWPVWAAVALTFACALAVWARLPPTRAGPGPSFRGAAALLRNRAVLAIYALTLTYFIAIFVVFSYIGPVLKSLAPLSPGALSLVISTFGVAGVVGTLGGGRAADRLGPGRSLTLSLSGLSLCLLLLPLTAGHPVLMVAVLMGWGVCGFSMMSPQQVRLAQLAGPDTPLALSLNNSMLYLGIALGAALGGAALVYLEPRHLPWVGAPFALAALAWLRLSTRRPSPP